MEFIRDDIEVWLDNFTDFIGEFVVPSQRQRLYYLLSKPKRRDEILGHFHSATLLDAQYLRAIKPMHGERQAAEIERLMKKLGATSRCYAFSLLESLDGDVDLKNALDESVGFCVETILYCPRAKVAYWEGGHCDRWVLCKS